MCFLTLCTFYLEHFAFWEHAASYTGAAHKPGADIHVKQSIL
jgi:hypothetical protein